MMHVFPKDAKTTISSTGFEIVFFLDAYLPSYIFD